MHFLMAISNLLNTTLHFMIMSCPSSTSALLTCAKAENIEELESTLTTWEKFVGLHFEDVKELNDVGIVEDYRCVMHILFDEIIRQKSQKDRDLFIVKAPSRFIQGLASCHSVPDPVSKKRVFIVDVIATAPWNLKLHSKISPLAKKGVGTLLMQQMLQKAACEKADLLKLDSTGSSVSFYKHLGLSLEKTNKFYCDPKDEGLKLKIEEIAKRLLENSP
jgi:hypothetical protein